MVDTTKVVLVMHWNVGCLLLVAWLTGCGTDACEELRTEKADCFGEVFSEEECAIDGAEECAACYVDNVADNCDNAASLDEMCASACSAYRSAS